MSVASMTGFARAEGGHGDLSWSWEIRSVNGKGLDMRVRVPSGWERLDPLIRGEVTKALSRGSVTISLDVSTTSAGRTYHINDDLLDRLADICRSLGEEPRIDRLLNVRGVVEQMDDGSSRALEDQDVQEAIVDTLREALGLLAESRLQEGGRIATVLHDRLGEIESLIEEAEAFAAAVPEKIGAKVRSQVDELLNSPAVSEERLAQEIALLASKADVREELDRLQSHIEAAREILSSRGAIGRKLDFLGQEFNREANTICSKSGDIELTRLGLALKGAVDQFREQIANIE